MLIGLIVLLAWLDAFVDGLDAPGWMREETWPPGMLVGAVLLIVGVMGAREVARMMRAKGVAIQTWFAAMVAMSGVLVVGLMPAGTAGTIGFAAGISTVIVSFVLGLMYAIRSRQVEGAVLVGAATVIIHVYMGLMLGFLLLIRREHEVWVLLWIVVCVKSCDIGAFFTGTLIGKHKLIEWLSPKKTWEGLFGGLVFSGVVGGVGAVLLTRWTGESLGWGWGAGMGVVFGGLGQMGDLTASLFKRDAGVKDAGTSMPGFGGVLDLVDSPVFVAPIAYWAITLVMGSGG